MRFDLKLLRCVPVLLLVIPYSTGFLAYRIAHGGFLISSALYATIASAIIACHAAFRRPILPYSVLLLLCLLCLRFVDAVVLGHAPQDLEESPTTLFAFSVVYCLALLCLTGDSHVLRWCALTCGAATVIIVCFLNLWEWHFPGSFSTVPGRSAGWLENPNDSGIAVCVMIGLLLALRLPVWFNVGIITISALGVYVTLSRGGFLVWLVTCLVYVLIQVRRGMKIIVLTCILLSGAFYLVSQVFDFGVTTTDPDQIRRQGLLTGASSLDIADDNRFGELQQSVKGIIREPILGYGTGSSLGHPFAPHNQAIAVWLDNGLAGILLFMTALGFLASECYRANLFVVVGCIPLVLEIGFSHNLLENKTYLFAWVMLAGLACHARRDKQKATTPIRASRNAGVVAAGRTVTARADQH